MTDKQYCIYSKVIAVLGCAGLYLLTGSMWSMLCLLLSAYMDRELKEER